MIFNLLNVEIEKIFSVELLFFVQKLAIAKNRKEFTVKLFLHIVEHACLFGARKILKMPSKLSRYDE